MDPQAQSIAQKRDAFLRELERKSLDTIMVYNPTNQDYFVEWDHRFHRVPSKDQNAGFGNGKMELPRYIADKYAREMKNKLITGENEQILVDLKEKLRKAGIQDVVLNANLEFERMHERRTDNEELIKKYYSVLYLGVVREYGMDMPLDAVHKPIDVTKTPEDLVLENMNKHYVEADIIDERPQPVQTDSVPPTVEEVTA